VGSDFVLYYVIIGRPRQLGYFVAQNYHYRNVDINNVQFFFPAASIYILLIFQAVSAAQRETHIHKNAIFQFVIS
jgi:hypothetical protein